MRHKLKQKRRNFEIIEILKRHNFVADAERGDANRGISVLKCDGLMRYLSGSYGCNG